jgi:hypothetical protein
LRLSTFVRSVIKFALLLVAFAPVSRAQDDFQLLRSFTFGVDGAQPNAGLVVNAAGTVIYGTADGGVTTYGGIPCGCGTVFELSLPTDPTNAAGAPQKRKGQAAFFAVTWVGQLPPQHL